MLNKEEFMELALSRYEAISQLEDEKDFYQYEKTFDNLWTDLGKEMLEKTISKVSADRRKKKKC